jgi:hypothetical protein
MRQQELLFMELHMMHCNLSGFIPSYTPTQSCLNALVEEADDLASDVLPPGLLVVHDTSRGGEDDVTELTRWEELLDPLLQVVELDVVTWRDDTSLVEAAVELDDDLAVAVVVDLLELANVAW